MHKVTVILEGIATDSASVELDDAAAFLLFIAMKRTLADGAPAKRKTRRGSSVTNDESGGTDAASENDEG